MLKTEGIYRCINVNYKAKNTLNANKNMYDSQLDVGAM